MAKISVFTRKNNWFVYKIKSINYTLYKIVFQSVKRRFLPLKIQKPQISRFSPAGRNRFLADFHKKSDITLEPNRTAVYIHFDIRFPLCSY
ncbi:hypothetical protein, partial [Enterococcus faecalis]|uniref:hypothetical protein n=1 Tax=Enterococcus faecalis TaxID=1351 RepID=UPI001E322889